MFLCQNEQGVHQSVAASLIVLSPAYREALGRASCGRREEKNVAFISGDRKPEDWRYVCCAVTECYLCAVTKYGFFVPILKLHENVAPECQIHMDPFSLGQQPPFLRCFVSLYEPG